MRACAERERALAQALLEQGGDNRDVAFTERMADMYDRWADELEADAIHAEKVANVAAQGEAGRYAPDPREAEDDQQEAA